jgi:opacity protein-like surface antigen
MGAATILGLKDKGATWGLRTGIQYANVDLNNNSTGSGSVSTFTDSFSLGGNLAPGAGFAGTFTGPNQLLGDVALTRTFGGSANVQISGNRSLNVHLAISQWGSYLEIPLCKKVDLTLEGGFLLALASGSYDYTNRVSIGNSGGQTVRGSNSRTRFLPGFYTGLGLNYEITDRLSLLANIRYQFLRSYEITANGSTAELDFSSAYVLVLRGYLQRMQARKPATLFAAGS